MCAGRGVRVVIVIGRWSEACELRKQREHNVDMVELHGKCVVGVGGTSGPRALIGGSNRVLDASSD